MKMKSNTKLPKVLVVEDNPDNMLTFNAVLKGKYEIIEAYDGEDGINKATAELPNLILLDMALPKVNGMAVVKTLKKQDETKHIPVIAVSAYSMDDMKEIFLRYGCDDFVSKPIDRSVLLKTMNKWLGD